jgi:serine/threonine protein kinase
MAHTLAYIHHQRVVISDIRLDNLLLDDDLNLKFADFGNSTLMPLDWDLCGGDDLGYSILTDIGQFGAVMFEIVAGHKCEFDIFHDWKEPGDPTSCPPRDSLPSTMGMWLGHIVEKCWTQGYKTANDVWQQSWTRRFLGRLQSGCAILSLAWLALRRALSSVSTALESAKVPTTWPLGSPSLWCFAYPKVPIPGP